MNKRTKLNKIWNILSPDQQVDFTDFDKQVADLKSKLKEKITVSTLADVQNQLERFKSKFNLQPLLDSLDRLNSSRAEYERVLGEIEKKTTELQQASEIQNQDLQLEIKTLTSELGNLEEKRQEDLKLIPNLNDIESRLGEMTTQLSSRVDALEEQEVVDWQDKLNSLRKELMARVNSIGGGSMNQRIQVNGTTMSIKYADFNLKGTGITVADNNTTKQVDIDLSGLVGGSSLADVAADSTDATKSLYTMTSTIPVEFKTSGGITLLKLNDAGTINIGGSADHGPNALLFGSAVGTIDVRLIRSGTNAMTFDRNGSGAITLNLGSSDGTLRTGSVADNGNNLTIKTVSTSRDIIFSPNSVEAMRIIQSSGAIDFSGNTIYHTDNTYDIGASGATRPRSLYLGTNLIMGGLTSTYNAVATTGYGHPAIYKSDRATGQTAAKVLSAFTVGASDGSFLISANVLITSSTLFNFTVTCTYTDEGNTSRVLTIPFTNLAGTALTSITNAAGTVPYEGIPQHIRCKAGTTIQIETAAGGTYTTVVYNFEECIQQIA